MKRVLIESPLRGWGTYGQRYARACVQDSLNRGEAPLASHLLYPQVLDDDVPEERALGIEAGLAWGAAAELTAVYQNLGISPGMLVGIERAKKEIRPIEYRRLPGWVPTFSKE